NDYYVVVIAICHGLSPTLRLVVVGRTDTPCRVLCDQGMDRHEGLSSPCIELAIHRLHGIAHQRRGSEVNAEALAPDGNRSILAEIGVSRQVIVLIADVSL